MSGHTKEAIFGRIGFAQLFDQRFLLFLRKATFQVCPHPHNYFTGLKGLGQIINATGGESFDHIVRFVFRRDKNDRRTIVGIFFVQLTAGLESIDPGHHDIK